MKTLALDKRWIFGAVSVEKTDLGLKPWRIPFKELPLFESNPNCQFEPMRQVIADTSGVRLELKTDATQLGLKTNVNETNADMLFDLTIDNQLIQTVALAPGNNKVFFDNIPAGDKELHIWLSARHSVTLVNLSVNDDAYVEPVDDKRFKWITHGSSITHCIGATSPARTWPAIAARERDFNLTSLGFGAGCHLDQHVARIIRDAEADFISLKIGINIIIVGSLGWRTFKPAVMSFIRTIREKHKTTPIAILSPIIAPDFENTKNCVNMTLQEMRSELQSAVKCYKQVYQDDNLHFFDGIKLLPEDKIDNIEGFIHPVRHEYEIMGHNFVNQVIDNVIK